MATIRDNTVTIESSKIQSVTYAGIAVVSLGQPMEPPPTINNQGATQVITFRAGRHKTYEVADGFNAVCGGASHEFCPSSLGAAEPDELNFYFSIKINWAWGGGTELYLGQGNNGSNNWWIGGNSVQTVNGQGRLVVPDGNNPRTFILSGGVSSFVLSEL